MYDGNNSLKQRFEYTLGHVPTRFTQAGQRYYILTDQVGTPKIISDAHGRVIKQIDYDSFGNVISDSNPEFEIPFGFAGGLQDTDAGLIRFGYRDYDPETGRWTARDPIGFTGGDTNLYGYVLGNPINLIDPEGLIAPVVALALGGLFGGAVELVSQLIDNGGNLDCVNWASVGVSAGAGLSLGGRLGYKATLEALKKSGALKGLTKKEVFDLRSKIKSDYRLVDPVRDALKKRDPSVDRVKNPVDSFDRTNQKYDVGLTAVSGSVIGSNATDGN